MTPERRPAALTRLHDVISREFARRLTDERLAEVLEEWAR
jgi:hypothetical protein